MVTVKDIAWAAGIYEGEGNFAVHHASIVQKDRWILDKLRTTFGFGTVLLRGNGSECHHWVISGQNARSFLLTIFTLLSPRRRKEILKHKEFFIDPLFKSQRVCRNGHVKTQENTTMKYDYRRKAWDWVCKDCRKERWLNSSARFRQQRQGKKWQALRG